MKPYDEMTNSEVASRLEDVTIDPEMPEKKIDADDLIVREAARRLMAMPEKVDAHPMGWCFAAAQAAVIEVAMNFNPYHVNAVDIAADKVARIIASHAPKAEVSSTQEDALRQRAETAESRVRELQDEVALCGMEKSALSSSLALEAIDEAMARARRMFDVSRALSKKEPSHE